MKENSKCLACGHVKVVYCHRLNVMLVSVLRKLVDFYEKNGRACQSNELEGLGLTYNQQSNFQKLKHFFLIKKIDKHAWMPTELGVAFIYGEAPSFDVAASCEDVTLDEHDAFWRDSGKTPMKIYVKDVDELCYKQRAEYKFEKKIQMAIF